MEDLKCPVCFEGAKEARACPMCAKVFCTQCLNKLKSPYDTSITCPHCRHRVLSLRGFLKLNFVENLHLEREKEIKEWNTKLLTKESELTLVKYEKDKLVREKSALMKENNQIITEKGALIREKATLMEDKKRLVFEKASLALERGGFQKKIQDRDVLYVKLKSETDKQMQEKDHRYQTLLKQAASEDNRKDDLYKKLERETAEKMREKDDRYQKLEDEIMKIINEKDKKFQKFEEETAKSCEHMVRAIADKCVKHPNQQMSLYCTTCHFAMCSKCRHDHPFDLIEDAHAVSSDMLIKVADKEVEMQEILNTETNHGQLKEELRRRCESWITKVASAMRRAHEKAILKATADVEMAFAQLKDFKANLVSELRVAESARESSMLNRLADKQLIIRQLSANADQILGDVSKIPAIKNLREGQPSVSVDTWQVLRPWLGGMKPEIDADSVDLNIACLFNELSSDDSIARNE